MDKNPRSRLLVAVLLAKVYRLFPGCPSARAKCTEKSGLAAKVEPSRGYGENLWFSKNIVASSSEKKTKRTSRSVSSVAKNSATAFDAMTAASLRG
jgi:hypothetical protein